MMILGVFVGPEFNQDYSSDASTPDGAILDDLNSGGQGANAEIIDNLNSGGQGNTANITDP